MTIDLSLKAWVKKWQRAAPLLQQQHDRELRESIPSQAIEMLSDAFEYALKREPLSLTSGLGQYQELLRKLFKDSK